MVIQKPRRWKYRKPFDVSIKTGKIKFNGRGSFLRIGAVGLKLLEAARLKFRYFTLLKRRMTRSTRQITTTQFRTGINAPLTGKSRGLRMGKGKGKIVKWVSNVRPGELFFEVPRITGRILRRFKRKIKLPLKTALVWRSRLYKNSVIRRDRPLFLKKFIRHVGPPRFRDMWWRRVRRLSKAKRRRIERYRKLAGSDVRVDFHDFRAGLEGLWGRLQKRNFRWGTKSLRANRLEREWRMRRVSRMRAPQLVEEGRIRENSDSAALIFSLEGGLCLGVKRSKVRDLLVAPSVEEAQTLRGRLVHKLEGSRVPRLLWRSKLKHPKTPKDGYRISTWYDRRHKVGYKKKKSAYHREDAILISRILLNTLFNLRRPEERPPQ